VGFEVFTWAKLGVGFEPGEGFGDGVASAGHLEPGVFHREDVITRDAEGGPELLLVAEGDVGVGLVWHGGRWTRQTDDGLRALGDQASGGIPQR